MTAVAKNPPSVGIVEQMMRLEFVNDLLSKVREYQSKEGQAEQEIRELALRAETAEDESSQLRALNEKLQGYEGRVLVAEEAASTAEAKLKTAQQQIAGLKAEVKTFKALNPQKMQDNLKRSKSRNSQLRKTIERLTRRNKQRDKDVEQLVLINDRHRTQQQDKDRTIDKLQGQVDTAVERINADMLSEPLWTDGEFAIYPSTHHNDCTAVLIADCDTDAQRLFHIHDGVQPLKTLPDGIKATALMTVTKMREEYLRLSQA